MTPNPEIIIIQLQRPPRWALRQQRVVIVRDASPSMKGDKARDADRATTELCHVLASPSNRDAFRLAVVDFDGKARVVHEFEKATALDERLRRLRVGFFASGTNITSGLERACDLLTQADENPSDTAPFARAVTVLLSDGQHNTGPAPYDIANKLKEVADLLCVAFGEAADLRTLRRLATTPKHCVRCSSGQELRQFFVQVGVTLTQTLGSHSDATIALAQITRSETER